jgi:nucleotide-binding universal stress UspA family protein
MSFLEVLFYVVLGWIFARILLDVLLYLLRAKNAQLKEELVQAAKELKDKIILVNIEKHGDTLYLFEKDTDRFIAQGKTTEEIMKHCKERFPKQSVIASESDAQLYNLL